MIGLFDGPRSAAPAPPLTGLKLWLKADTGVTQSGGIASAWADQSGNSNDATVSGGDIGARLDTNIVNGLPGLNSFYGTTVQMGGTSRLLADASPYHIVTVIRPAPVSAGSSPGGFDVGGGFANIGSGLQSVFGDFAGSVFISPTITESNVPIANDTPYAFELASDGTTQTGAINGTALTLTSTVPMAVTGAGWCLFDDPLGGNGPFWGWVCEVLIYDHVLSSPDLTSARAYINSRYGV